MRLFHHKQKLHRKCKQVLLTLLVSIKVEHRNLFTKIIYNRNISLLHSAHLNLPLKKINIYTHFNRVNQSSVNNKHNLVMGRTISDSLVLTLTFRIIFNLSGNTSITLPRHHLFRGIFPSTTTTISPTL